MKNLNTIVVWAGKDFPSLWLMLDEVLGGQLPLIIHSHSPKLQYFERPLCQMKEELKTLQQQFN